MNLYVLDGLGYDLILWWNNTEAWDQVAVVYEHYTWRVKEYG